MQKCPKCEQTLTQARLNGLPIYGPDGRTWNGIAISCPYCHTALSVMIDPIAIKSDLVNELKRT
jgi:hypothetical protein